jgi:pyruvate dehydrogenase E1 component alpha subunit
MTIEPQTIIAKDGSAGTYEHGLTDDELLHIYRTMLRVRAFDEISMKLQRSGRIGFSVPNEGIEACQVGAASALRKSDWIFPSYRDFGMALYHGIAPVDMLHNMFGSAEDSNRGRQMPAHFSFVEPIRFVSISSPIGTHLPQAVGAAYAAKYRGEDTVALVSFGDGGTSSSGFHSGMNFAAVLEAPVVFLCQNNGWAISCPSSSQTVSESYAAKAVAYGMPGVVVDGNDVLAMRRAVVEAVERAREGGGPSLVEAKTYRVGGHSSSDDPSKYVPQDELEKWRARDPIPIFESFLEASGLWTAKLKEKIFTEARKEIVDAARVVENTAAPALETVFSEVYAEIPAHLREQGRSVFELARRRGDAAAGTGEFPL